MIQEVVPVSFENEEVSIPTAPLDVAIPESSNNSIAIRLRVHGICVEIANSAS